MCMNVYQKEGLQFTQKHRDISIIECIINQTFMHTNRLSIIQLSYDQKQISSVLNRRILMFKHFMLFLLINIYARIIMSV